MWIRVWSFGIGLIFLLAGDVRGDGHCDFDNLNCDDTTLEEERTHSASCEVLMDSLYNLEMAGGGYNDKPKDQTTYLQNIRHRDERRKRNSARELFRKKRNATENGTAISGSGNASQSSIGQPYNPPFFPSVNMTPFENQVRLQVCRALLQLPGVRRRCCTTVWVSCPEFGPDTNSKGTPAPPAPVFPPIAPKPEPSPPQPLISIPSFTDTDGGSIFESSASSQSQSPVQSILSNIANNFVGAFKNFLNSQAQQQPDFSGNRGG